MNRIVKKASTLAAELFLLTGASLSADDFSFDDVFAEDDSAAFGGGESTPSLKVNGTLEMPVRLYTGDLSDGDSWTADNWKNNDWEIDPRLRLDLSYSAGKADFFASLNLDENTLTDNPTDLFEELYVAWYDDKFDASLGYQIAVWGKGDKLHVVDVLNPLDYTDIYNQDYLDMKIPQFMARVNIPLGMNSLLELAYVPTFTPDRLAMDGRWAMNEANALTGAVTTAVTNSAAMEYQNAYKAELMAGGTAIAADMKATAAMALFAEQYGNAEAFLPETNTLEYGQGALHFTSSMAGVDFGALYYCGFMRQPTIAITPTAPALTVEDIDVNYDRVHVFGLEAGTVLAGFNLRGEAAYYMTEDFDGTDAAVMNPSMRYLAGFDRNLPLHNLNVNFQALGIHPLMTDDIKMGDVEYNNDGSTTFLVTKISDSFNHEKLKPEVLFFYNVEDNNAFLRPTLEMEYNGNFSMKFSGTGFWGEDDTFFGQFSDNDFIQIETIFRF